MVVEFATGALVGGVAGFFIAKYQASQKTDTSEKSVMLGSLMTQVTEMKSKFDSFEQMREQKEKYLNEFNEEREKRLQEFMESTRKFYSDQEEIRKDSEQKRDGQIDKMSNVMAAFNRTIHGTKTRGNMGEDILKQYLSESIKVNLVKSNLKTDNGNVEFAWNLGDGKFLPIDAKFPDIIEQVESITDDSTQSEKNTVIKQISNKIRSQINTVKKYQNQSNTIDKCVLAVPESALQLCPELISEGIQENVFVCSPNQVFFVGFIISEEYAKLKDDGDLGELKQLNKSFVHIIKEILKLSQTISTQANSVIKHNNLILDKVSEALRL